ncbi:unnamed protein product, partial [Brachionus calyciflorus]
MKSFETLNFDNLVLRTLPLDPITENYVRQVKNACFSKVKPTPLENPQMVVYSKTAMNLLDLDDEQLKRKEAAEYLSGNKLMPGSETASHCYCGHQFGIFAGQLGDGAAIYLGEILNNKNERWEIQLKGAGLTPYSRSADGRKVLRSTLREFLCSEAMHFLGVPTTRAGSCLVSDSKVVRDIFYDGNAKLERCAVVLRIAQSFIRFGSFEIFRPLDRDYGGIGPSFGRNDILIKMLDYVSDTFYPHIKSEDKHEKYENVFKEIVNRTARLVAGWQCNGWVHGVLNTDNMSILGLTIDYGPYGFLDRYDPDHIFNGSDTSGRYTYRNQVDICEWNCIKLAEALSSVLDLNQLKDYVKQNFKNEYNKAYMEKMMKKFGLKTSQESDIDLFNEFFETMYETGADFTNSFRKLSLFDITDNKDEDIKKFMSIILEQCASVDEIRGFFKPKMPKETLDKLISAMEDNPGILEYFGLSEVFVKNQLKFIEKYEKLKGKTSEDKKALDTELWSTWFNKYRERINQEMDPKSENFDAIKAERVKLMNSNNPRFILRNHIAQDAIENVDKNDFTGANMLLRILENPFSDEPVEKILSDFDQKLVKEKVDSNFYEKPPLPTKCVKLT